MRTAGPPDRVASLMNLGAPAGTRACAPRRLDKRNFLGIYCVDARDHDFWCSPGASRSTITCGTLALSRAQCRLCFQSAAARFGRVAVERLSPVLQAPFAYEPWSRATLLTLPL